MERDSTLYIAASKQLFLIENNKISSVGVEGEVGNFSSLAASKEGTIWLGTYGKGLYYQPKGKTGFVKFRHPNLSESANIQDLLVDKNNKLWIATYDDGAYLLDIKTKTIQHFIANKKDPYALHYDDVLCLYEDFTGTIWLGTDGAGLSYYDE